MEVWRSASIVRCWFMLTDTMLRGQSVIGDGDGRVRGVGGCGVCGGSGRYGKGFLIRGVPSAIVDLAEFLPQGTAHILGMMPCLVAVDASDFAVA